MIGPNLTWSAHLLLPRQSNIASSRTRTALLPIGPHLASTSAHLTVGIAIIARGPIYQTVGALASSLPQGSFCRWVRGVRATFNLQHRNRRVDPRGIRVNKRCVWARSSGSPSGLLGIPSVSLFSSLDSLQGIKHHCVVPPLKPRIGTASHPTTSP
jgi:hypothetical protein